jgi:hypothetical protein
VSATPRNVIAGMREAPDLRGPSSRGRRTVSSRQGSAAAPSPCSLAGWPVPSRVRLAAQEAYAEWQRSDFYGRGRAPGGNRYREPKHPRQERAIAALRRRCHLAEVGCRCGMRVARRCHDGVLVPNDMAEKLRERAASAPFRSRLSRLAIPRRSSPRVCRGLNRTA